MIKKIIPHLTFLSMLIMLFVIGLIWNVGWIGGFFGGVFALMLDPLIFVSSIILGFTVYKQFNLLLTGVLLAVLISIIVHYINTSLGVTFTAYKVVLRFISIMTIAYFINIIRVLKITNNHNKNKG